MQKELCQGLKEEVMASNNFDETMAALFKGMDGFITSKTVVGDAIKFEDGTTILPLVDVSFGAGAGAFASESKKKDNGVGAMSGKITPSSVLVIKNGNVRLVNIKNQDTITRLLDMIPDLSEKFSKMMNKNKENKTSEAGADDKMPETEEEIAKKLNK